MSVQVLYTTKAKATGGREGAAETLDGSFSVKLNKPKELGGTGGEGNNPEQLFAAGYAACFLGALQFVAGQEKAKLPAETSIVTEVGIGKRAAGGFGLTVALEASIPGMDRELAEALVAKAHQTCPYSNATRDNIDVQLAIA